MKEGSSQLLFSSFSLDYYGLANSVLSHVQTVHSNIQCLDFQAFLSQFIYMFFEKHQCRLPPMRDRKCPANLTWIVNAHLARLCSPQVKRAQVVDQG